MKATTRKRNALLAAALVVASSGLVAGSLATANVGNSLFEGNDGNTIVNTAGNKDWVSAPGVTVSIQTDQATGQCDNSFTQGSKEDETNVVIGLGSIPNSKADLGKFGVGSETLPNGHVMMYLAWTRNNLSGTTNFDFEINQAAQPNMVIQCPGVDRPITLNRIGDAVANGGPGGSAIDDILINYDIQGGAQNPTLGFRRWTGSAWSAPIALNSTNSEGRISSAPVVFDGVTYPAAAFGEAAIDMTAAGIIPNRNDPNAPCTGFGSAYVKSRASSSFTAQMKDYIAPAGIGLNTCGSITIDKVTVPAADPQLFTFTPSANLGGGATFQLADATTPKVYGALSPGTYSVAETVPAGWDLTSFTCTGGVGDTPASITLGANENVICTATNTKRATVIIDKVTTPDPDPTNTVFDFTSNIAGTGTDTQSNAAFSLTNAQAAHNSGSVVPGAYSVSETVEPGWTPTGSTCVDLTNDSPNAGNINAAAGETVTCTFTNNGFGRIEVTKQTDPDGSTQSFSYATTGSGYVGPFNLTDGQTNGQNVAPGEYSVAETVPAGWELSDIVCVDPTGAPVIDLALGKATINVAPGELVTCLYTNEQDASITVTKTVNGPDPGQAFTFTSDFGVTPLKPSDPLIGDTFNSGPLDPDTYNVTEDGIANWLLKNADPAPGTTGAGGNVVCSDNSNSGSISLQAGEHVLCAFVNEWQVGAVAVQKSAKHAGPNGAPTLAGVQFQVIALNTATPDPADTVTIDMPLTDATGYTCLGNFGPQVVSIHEVPVPGYAGLPDVTGVQISAVSHCPEVGYGNAPTLVPVENIPLTRVSVSVNSLIDGGTASVVSCVDQDGNGIGVDGVTDGNGDGTFGPSGDLGLDESGLQVVTCTITIDP